MQVLFDRDHLFRKKCDWKINFYWVWGCWQCDPQLEFCLIQQKLPKMLAVYDQLSLCVSIYYHPQLFQLPIGVLCLCIPIQGLPQTAQWQSMLTMASFFVVINPLLTPLSCNKGLIIEYLQIQALIWKRGKGQVLIVCHDYCTNLYDCFHDLLIGWGILLAYISCIHHKELLRTI